MTRLIMSLPFARSNRVNPQTIHGINLLKTTVLGLHHEEKDNKRERQTTTGKHQAVPVVDSVRDEASTNNNTNKHQIKTRQTTLDSELGLGVGTYKKEMRKFKNQFEAMARAMQGAR